MYKASDYLHRAGLFLRNQAAPGSKRLSNLMIYATDLCDSGCKHCMIWTKRPVQHLPKEKIFALVTENKCITPQTTIGLEGGEFMLHPDALEILEWFTQHHPNFDLLSNGLKPDKLIEAVKKFPPRRLYISLDGDQDTYLHMRGKDGYHNVLRILEALRDTLPISVMFTLSPYNDLGDMQHVAEVCKQYGVDLRIGIYNNISFFDTIDTAHVTPVGEKKNDEVLDFSSATTLKKIRAPAEMPKESIALANRIPAIIKDFKENYDFLVLYDQWKQNKLQLRCFSILDSMVVLPNGDVPICQNLDLKLGNIHRDSLDTILNTEETIHQQDWHSKNCNKCWINYHRKYDVVLYRTFENLFGRWATKKMFGYYQWDEDARMSYNRLMEKQAS